MYFESSQQLDIFNDSRDVMLRNDLVQAFQAYDVAGAQAAVDKLHCEYPDDPMLADASVLLRAVQARSSPATSIGFCQHADLRRHRLALLDILAPAAHRWMDARTAQTWLHPFWLNLIARSNALVFRADAEQDHAAWMWLQLQDWQTCADQVAQIESWRRIPAPLAWMTQAKLQLTGLRATWPLLAELAWLAPQRLPALTVATPAPQLQRLMEQFESVWDELEDCEPFQHAIKQIAAHADSASAWAWFPAWVLTAQPQHAPDLALAQSGQYTPPEQALRLLVNLLGLEHQGRHHDLVKQRKSLRDLHAGLYAAYLKTR